MSGRSPGRLGNAHPNIVPYATFTARDGRSSSRSATKANSAGCAHCSPRRSSRRMRASRRNQQRVVNRVELTALLNERLQQEPSRIGCRGLPKAASRRAPSTRSGKCSQIRRCSTGSCESSCRARISATSRASPVPIRLSRSPVRAMSALPPRSARAHGEVLRRAAAYGRERRSMTLRRAPASSPDRRGACISPRLRCVHTPVAPSPWVRLTP